MRKEKSYELVLTALFTAIIVLMAFTPLGYIPLVVINATIIHIPVILGALFCGPKKGAFLGFVFGLTSFVKNTLMPTSLSAFVFSPVLAYSLDGPSGIIKSTIICFVPRILVGIVPYFVYKGVTKLVSGKRVAAAKLVCNFVISVILIFSVHAFLIRLLEGGSAELIGWIAGTVVAVLYLGLADVAMKKKEGAFLGYIYAGLAGALTNTLLVMPLIYIFYKEAYASALSIDASAVMNTIMGVITFNGIIEALVAAILVTAIGTVLARIRRR
ncbi:MAG: ECF transporter S component [Lachnospiraceae bacterium]|nr:ECF transporter S component [Lachnospiraceae bacterium]